MNNIPFASHILEAPSDDGVISRGNSPANYNGHSYDKSRWMVERIEIPHEEMEKDKLYDKDIRRIIEVVVNETKKNHSVETIARKQKLDTALVEKIVRLYITHPDVTVDGIMTKMGL